MLSAVLPGCHCLSPKSQQSCSSNTQGAGPLPPSSTVAKAGRNYLNEEITPLLPTGIGERHSQTISNLGPAALLHRCELLLLNESAEVTREALYLIYYCEVKYKRLFYLMSRSVRSAAGILAAVFLFTFGRNSVEKDKDITCIYVLHYNIV